MPRQIAFSIAGLFVASIAILGVLHATSSETAQRNAQMAATAQTISPYKQNAFFLNGSVVPAYQTNDGLVAFLLSGGKLLSYAHNGTLRWSQNSTASGLSGGMDLNSDTYPEVVTTSFTDATCTGTSQGEVRDGKTGSVLASLSPLQNNCFNGVGIQRWFVGSVLMGPLSIFAEVPQYWSQGWFMQYQNDSLKAMTWYTSSDASFDTYTAATTLPNYNTSPYPHVPNSMLPNGLLMTGSDGAPRMVAFTSARVSQYKVADLSPSQLISDTELVTGNRPDAGGRNYGLVARTGSKVVLISGANAYSLLGDVKAGSAVTDSYGAIARHFAVFDTTNAKVLDRFYSYANDGGGSYQYINRITYPAHPIVDLSGTPYVFFNVYDGSHWYVSVNTLDLTEVTRVNNIYIWDTTLRTDGTRRFVVSLTSGYWPTTPHKTSITYYQNAAFIPELTKDGLPIMGVAFKEANISSSEGFLMNVLVTDQGLETDGTPAAASLVMYPAQATVSYNGNTTIYWSALNTSSCTFYTNGAEGQTLSGGASAFDTGSLQQNMTYAMRCLGRDGMRSEVSAVVTVDTSQTGSSPPPSTEPSTPGSLPGQTSSAKPTANLWANGQKNISAHVGSYITYAWSSSNAVSARATYTTDTPACGRTTVGPFSMVITSLRGSMRSVAVPQCLAGHTRTVTYIATGADGSEARASIVQTISQ